MITRVPHPVKLVARITVAIAFAACGGSVSDPGTVPVTPVPPTLVAGSSQTFVGAINTVHETSPSVVLKDPAGAPISGAWIKWTTTSGKVENDSSITDSNGRANAGKWTFGTVSGLQTVTARSGTVSVVAMTANVAPGPLSTLVSASPNITGVVGTNVSAPPSVKAVDAFGNGVPGVLVQFAMWSGDGSITGPTQTTNENGLATVGSWKLGPKSGTQQIRVDDHRTGLTTLLNATALPAAASQFVIIDGNAQTGQANKRLCTSPVIAVRDQFGNGIGQVPIVFTPSTNSGTVTDGSTVSAVGTGYAAVGAWTLSDGATQTLAVTSPTLPGVTATLTATVVPSTPFTVCARYFGEGGTPRQRQAVTTAIQRWQRVIAAHVQSSQLTEAANRCFPGTPAINEVVEDLLVFVQITTLDGPGNAVARAGPCTVHLPSGLTQMGVLQLDSADMELLLGQGTLDNMVTHEFGHVLGFGTLWRSSARDLLGGLGTDDPFFTGASARTQFLSLFSSYTGNVVPVENTGDVGTRDTHWRRSVFNNELMQGFSQAVMPMSRVTVASLGDLGYAVDLTKSDPFTFTGATPPMSMRAPTVPGADLTNDVIATEIWGVEKNGRRTLVRASINPLARSSRGSN